MDLLAPEYANQTSLHPAGMVALAAAAVVVLSAPRRWVVPTLFAVAVFITPAQRLAVGGLDFTVLRLLLVLATARVFFREDMRQIRPQPIDYAVLLGGLILTFVPLANGAHGNPATVLVRKLGLVVFDTMLLYVVLRMMIRSLKDLTWALSAMALICVPVAGLFLVEWSTGRNLFSMLGGVPEWTKVRKGRLRCQGAFVHPIIAGCFFAALFPVFVMWPWDRAKQWIGWAGAAACLVIVVACASSTPIGGVGVAVVGMLLYPARSWLRPARWVIAAGLVFVHFAREKPIWHLLAEVKFVGGSTGWHRYTLIDAFVNNADEWWLAGTGSTMHWGFGLIDVTNQYVSYGVNAGILGVLALLAVIFVGYMQIGRTLRDPASGPTSQRAAYAVGVMLTVHVVCFIGITYFGQGVLAWYLTLALVGVVAPMYAGHRAANPEAGSRAAAERVSDEGETESTPKSLGLQGRTA
ncbi:MAG: hypothetical protein AAGH92_01395 [Planctomycetota bacterium]